VSRTVGIPRVLLYYPFFPFWKRFFEELGFEVVVSSPMTKRVFDGKPRRFVGDICLPIESAFYHVETIKEDVDILLLPRLNNIHRDAYACPACAGFPYVVRHRVEDLPQLLTINLSPFLPPERSDRAALKKLGISSRKTRSAYRVAKEDHDRFTASAMQEPDLDAAITRWTSTPRREFRPTERTGPHILLLGMPYVLADPFVSQGVPDLLERMGCCLTTPHMVAPEIAGEEVEIEDYSIYWTFAGVSVVALEKMLNKKGVDGVVYCSSFACGVDSLILPIIQSACHRCYDVPACILTMDEHSEGSYLSVRLEAFIDVVTARRERRRVSCE
jgi:predicted nucleotide-binding protein (sugar kinase/HSP70/actin superfamily)